MKFYVDCKYLWNQFDVFNKFRCAVIDPKYKEITNDLISMPLSLKNIVLYYRFKQRKSLNLCRHKQTCCNGCTDAITIIRFHEELLHMYILFQK